MNVTIFNGSPRKNGNTSELVKRIMARAPDNVGLESISLFDKKISGCMNCGACQKGPLPSYCTIDDDMRGLYDKFLSADVILLATPIYMWQFTPCMLAFLNRLHCLCRHSTPDNMMKGKKIAVCVTLGDEPEVTEFSVNGFKEFCEYFSLDYLGEIIIPYAEKEKISYGDYDEEVEMFIRKTMS
jgi:Multimeric flavodoxin WrbA